MLLEPEFLAAIEADVNLVANLISLRNVMPEKTKDTARQVISKVVGKLMERLRAQDRRGAARRGRPRRAAPIGRAPPTSTGPVPSSANLRHYQAEQRTIVPETADRFHAPAAQAGRSRRGLPVRRPIRLDGKLGDLRLDLRSCHGIAAGGEDEARLLRHRRPGSDGRAVRSGRGVVRRPARRRHRHQSGGRLLRRAHRATEQGASGIGHRPVRGRRRRRRCWQRARAR